MLDGDFERNKNLIKSKLPEYLKSKGINVDKNFRCLNPEHLDVNPSMSYNRANETVHCFACNATYDIFQLVGIDLGLTSFIEQYNKLRQIYNIDSRTAPESSEVHKTTVTFGAKKDNYTRENLQTFNSAPVNFHALANDPNIDPLTVGKEKPSFHTASKPVAPSDAFSNFTPPGFSDPRGFKIANEDNLNTQQPGNDTPHITNAVFGKRSIGAVPLNHTNTPFSQNQYNPHNFAGYTTENHISYKEYLDQCHRNVDATDYFKIRGISQSVIDRFNLGYDMRFEIGPDSMSHDNYIWRAAIIPSSEFAYTARNTDPKAKDRIRKKGHQGIFNKKALDKDGAIFITEGEFDALSIETLGFSAIALGGAGNTQPLIDYVKEHSNPTRIFYIALDNDEAGNNCAKSIAAAFMQLQIPFKRVNISFPYKDPNEALVKDRHSLLYRLENIDKILSFTLRPVMPPNGSLKLIYDNESLSRLSLSPMLYSMTGDAISLRNTVCSIIEDKLSRIIYAGNFNQWQLLCNLFKVEHNELGQIQYASWHNASFIEIESQKDLVQTLNHAVTSCRIQNLTDFTLVVDLLCYSSQDIASILPEIGHICSQNGISTIVLLQNNHSDLAISNSLQNLQITMSSNGYELIVRSRDLQGRCIEFSRYCGA